MMEVFQTSTLHSNIS